MSNQPEWYSPIRKVPLEYMGVKSNAWSVQIEHLTDKSEWKEVGVVSDNYLLEWKTIYVFHDSKRYHRRSKSW